MAAPRQKSKVASKKATSLSRIKKFRWWQIAIVILVIAITGIAILRLSHASSENIDDIYHEVQGEQAKARAGQGNNEGVSTPCKVNADGSRSGVANGWAYDPLNPAASTQMHLYFDAPGGPGFPVTANLPSGDVNAAFNIGGAHRYAFPIPPQYYDGNPHSITAYAIGSAGNNMVGWIVFRCYPKAATPPPSQPPSTPPTPTPTPTPTSTHPGGTPQPTAPPPVNPAKVSSVVSLISKGIVGTNGQSGSTSSANSSNPTQLATVDLLDTSKNLSSSDLLAIDKKIDDIPADKLSTLTGTVTLKPNIPASKNVVLVGYYLNKKLHYYTDKPPFNYEFDTTRLSNGAYRLDVVGFDKDGNQVTRLVQKFNVVNHLNLIEQLRNDITYPFYKLSNPN
jgi:hypothetical protein